MIRTAYRLVGAQSTIRLRVYFVANGSDQQDIASVRGAGTDDLIHFARRGKVVVTATRKDGRWSPAQQIAALEQGGGEEAITLSLHRGTVVAEGSQTRTELAFAPTDAFSIDIYDGAGVEATSACTKDTLRQLIHREITPSGMADKLVEDLIFDVGANNGDDTEFYLLKGFRVVAVEANPVLCDHLAARFEDAVAAGNLKVLNVGLAPRNGEMTFYVNLDHDEWSSFDKEVASRGHPVKEAQVRTVTLASIYKAFGVPYYLKIDIEGYDHIAVLAAATHPTRPRHISFENGAPALMEALADAGYDRFQLVNQAFVPEMRCPEPAREGETVAMRFPFGASGPFGDDLPDAWLPREAMRAKLDRHVKEVAERPDTVSGHWFDLHASRPMP